MSHAVLGPGGVGGLVGAVLAHAGESVTVIVRSGALERHPRELSLESRLGSFSVPVSVTASLDRPVDVLWITVKATDLRLALDSISSVRQIGAIVPLLNGIDHVGLLRERFGYEKIVPATIAVEAERIAPGKIVQRSPFVRLNISMSGQSLLEETVQEFSRLDSRANSSAMRTPCCGASSCFWRPSPCQRRPPIGPSGKLWRIPLRWRIFRKL